jgi:hypothetical protein
MEDFAELSPRFGEQREGFRASFEGAGFEAVGAQWD